MDPSLTVPRRPVRAAHLRETQGYEKICRLGALRNLGKTEGYQTSTGSQHGFVSNWRFELSTRCQNALAVAGLDAGNWKIFP
jgi:hypothetical protein